MTAPQFYTVTAADTVRLTDAASLGADFRSGVADFKDMCLGSLQAVWQGEDADDGTFTVWASNLRDEETFAPLTELTAQMAPDRQAILWNLAGNLGFRYAQLRYATGTVTTGTVSVYALAKKGAGGMM